MSYCPEDGWHMEQIDESMSMVKYHCIRCGTTWVYSAEEGSYTVEDEDGD